MIGRSISVGSDNESFTSQLTFTVSKTLNGTTIKCTTESDANIVSANLAQNQLLLLLTEGNLTIIINNNYFEILLNKWRMMTKNLISDNILPPVNVTLSHFHDDQLTFAWNSPTQHCPSLYYIITSTNCGKCPGNTTSTSVTCDYPLNASLTLDSSICSLSVQSLICDNLYGTFSELLQVSIEG